MKDPSVEDMVTVGIAALSCPFMGCQSLRYRLRGECLEERQLELGHNVCDCRSQSRSDTWNTMTAA